MKYLYLSASCACFLSAAAIFRRCDSGLNPPLRRVIPPRRALPVMSSTAGSAESKAEPADPAEDSIAAAQLRIAAKPLGAGTGKGLTID
eukprot:3250874-Pleurochrysis_carterae.AAC.2